MTVSGDPSGGNTFTNKGDGDQNVAQGDGAIGKQENVRQEMRGHGNISSGTGNVTVNQGLRVKPRTVLLASLLGAVLLGAGITGWYWFAPISPPVPVTNSVSTTGGNAPATVAGRDAAVTYNTGVTPDAFARYAGELAVTDAALASFFKTLEEQKVPRSDLDARLREIAATHKELVTRLATVQSEDPEVVRLKQEAGQAIEAGEYAKAEDLLNRAEARDVEAIEELEQAARQRRISAAATNADLAELQRVQLRYAKAAEYWQKAAGLLPEGEKKDRSRYLHSAAFDLDRVSRYSEALPLYEQSLVIYREIGDRAGEGTTLNNISQIYDARGEYDKALKYLEQSLTISKEIGDRAGEGTTLNNISQIYDARGKYDTALNYLEQSLVIRQEIGDRAGEGTTLNNLATTAYAKGEYDKALKYLEQSLVIMEEIGAKMEEAVISWNIGHVYKAQGDLAKAEQYMTRTVEIDKAIGRPGLERKRKALEELRAEIRGR